LTAIVTAKAGETEKASSVFPAADIFTYYEKGAGFNSSDRGFIIEKGFREWLLAADIDHTPQTAAISHIGICAPHTNPRAADLVILLANLIGGAI